MNWFERITGIKNESVQAVTESLYVSEDRLHSRVNGRSFGVGTFELVSLAALRDGLTTIKATASQRLRFRGIVGDVRVLHRDARFESALFQVASQFNALEMFSSRATPEMGVGRYETDRTQGPACAIAAGAGTIFRNYFVPVYGQVGQTASRQLDGSADLREVLAAAIGIPARELWLMRIGYLLCNSEELTLINRHLVDASEDELERLRGLLRFGLQTGVEVTDGDLDPSETGPMVSQIYCSAIPVAAAQLHMRSPIAWEPFARLVLEAAYEATLAAAVLNVSRGGSNVVLLTYLGGGAFGNDMKWIEGAMRRALERFSDRDLDVVVVSYGQEAPFVGDLEKIYELDLSTTSVDLRSVSSKRFMSWTSALRAWI